MPFIVAVYAAVLGFVERPDERAGAALGDHDERPGRRRRDDRRAAGAHRPPRARRARSTPPRSCSNKRGFHEALDAEFDRARRHDLPLAVAVIEVEGLAAFDERGRRSEGLLERLGDLARGLRATETSPRASPRSGSRFVLPHTDRDGRADRLRARCCGVSRRPVRRRERRSAPSASASPPSPPMPAPPRRCSTAPTQAVAAAEHLGRDRVVVYSPEIAAIVLAAESRRGQARGSNLAAVLALTEVLDIRDAGTAHHSQTVGRYAEAIARGLGLPDDLIERVRLAGILHDVGKIAVPDAVLSKPGKLTDEEWTEMRKHPEVGALIVDGAELKDVAAWVLAHHERPDGRGYPRGLAGDEIPLEARILAVADAYEAMTVRPRLPARAARRGRARRAAQVRRRAVRPARRRGVPRRGSRRSDARGESAEADHFASLVRGLADRNARVTAFLRAVTELLHRDTAVTPAPTLGRMDSDERAEARLVRSRVPLSLVLLALRFLGGVGRARRRRAVALDGARPAARGRAGTRGGAVWVHVAGRGAAAGAVPRARRRARGGGRGRRRRARAACGPAGDQPRRDRPRRAAGRSCRRGGAAAAARRAPAPAAAPAAGAGAAGAARREDQPRDRHRRAARRARRHRADARAAHPRSGATRTAASSRSTSCARSRGSARSASRRCARRWSREPPDRGRGRSRSAPGRAAALVRWRARVRRRGARSRWPARRARPPRSLRVLAGARRSARAAAVAAARALLVAALRSPARVRRRGDRRAAERVQPGRARRRARRSSSSGRGRRGSARRRCSSSRGSRRRARARAGRPRGLRWPGGRRAGHDRRACRGSARAPRAERGIRLRLAAPTCAGAASRVELAARRRCARPAAGAAAPPARSTRCAAAPSARSRPGCRRRRRR